MTVDEITDILSQTVLSLKGAWGMAVASFLEPRVASLRIALVIWAVIVSIGHLLQWINLRIADSMSGARTKRSTLKKGDTVVITGAANGLGLCLCALFHERGCRVITIDKKPMPINMGESQHFQMDVSDEAEVLKMAKSTEAAPAVVINCAGCVFGGDHASLSSADIKNMVNVNYLGALWVTRAFLPAMIEAGRGTVVAISSSTALAPPAQAGVYAATKAALRSSFEALRYELRNTGVNTLVVTPGQLDTAMFASVQTPSAFLAPVVRAIDMAQDTLDAVLAGHNGEIMRPFYVKLLPWSKGLPQSVVDVLRQIVGIDEAMQSFTVEQQQ